MNCYSKTRAQIKTGDGILLREAEKKRQSGFTLIELMVVVVIIGIITAFAYPAYQDSVRKSRRSDAKAALSDLAAREEQHRLDNKVYTIDLPSLGASAQSPERYYTLGIVAGGAGIATSYLITATATGTQASDTKCATLSLSSTGAKTSAPTASCW